MIVVNTEVYAAMMVTIISAFIASSGFWAYLAARREENSATTQLLLGLAYSRLMELGMWYLSRGWITKDEFEEYEKYLYKPYIDLSGNGSAKHIMDQINGLPYKNIGDVTPHQRRRTAHEYPDHRTE